MSDLIAASASLHRQIRASIDESQRLRVRFWQIREEAREALTVGRDAFGEAQRTAAAVNRCTTAEASVRR